MDGILPQMLMLLTLYDLEHSIVQRASIVFAFWECALTPKMVDKIDTKSTTKCKMGHYIYD